MSRTRHSDSPRRNRANRYRDAMRLFDPALPYGSLSARLISSERTRPGAAWRPI